MRKSTEFVDERYTGLFLRELAELVAMAEDSVNQTGWELVIAARTHLSNGPMDEGDVQAWIELGEIQDCLLNDTTRICCHCGEMEGRHRISYKLGHVYCRIQSLFSGDQRLSSRFEPVSGQEN